MTMQRARRLASVVVVASLGVAGLSACRSEPSVAAYVGDSERITQDRVDAVYNEVRDKLQAAPAAPETPDGQPAAPAPTSSGPVTVPITRTDVLSLLVGSQLIDKIAAAQSVTPPADLQEPAIAAALRLPADSEYAQLYAKWRGLISALIEKAPATGTPTDAEFHELHDSLLAVQGVDPSLPFAQFKSQIAQGQNMPLVQRSVAVRDEIVKATSAADVRVNPRYQPAKLPVLDLPDQNSGRIYTLMTAPIGPNDLVAPVTDAR
jgi:hypothetical protein